MDRAAAGGMAHAQVMAHCGADFAAAVHYVTCAIAAEPEPYAVVAE
ncbi:hypothetical protein ACIRG5_41400 [Lentzea sp. NPDC102401]